MGISHGVVRGGHCPVYTVGHSITDCHLLTPLSTAPIILALHALSRPARVGLHSALIVSSLAPSLGAFYERREIILLFTAGGGGRGWSGRYRQGPGRAGLGRNVSKHGQTHTL